jgi:hypothetical protein
VFASFCAKKLLGDQKVAHDSFYVDPTQERTLIMNANFVIAAYDLEQIARSGYGNITCKVVGYWSRDSISLYVRRNFTWAADSGKGKGEWGFEVSHGSGGRDTKEVPSDLDAAANFGSAIIGMADLGKQLATQIEQLEVWYQDERAALKAQMAAERAAEQARIDADPAIGEQRAKLAIDAAMAACRANGQPIDIRAVHRGQEDANTLRIERKVGSGMVRITLNGYASSRQEAIAKLAAASVRTVLA